MSDSNGKKALAVGAALVVAAGVGSLIEASKPEGDGTCARFRSGEKLIGCTYIRGDHVREMDVKVNAENCDDIACIRALP